MLVSEKHQYVYIAIPKTGTKSMRVWLMTHFDATKVDTILMNGVCLSNTEIS